MGKSQRTKGASFEREVCDLFTAALRPEEKFTRNIGQARDGGYDIPVGLLAVEAKRRKTLGTVYSWLQQCITAAAGKKVFVDPPAGREYDPFYDGYTDVIPIVVAREDQGEPIVILRFPDFITLAGDRIKASL